MPQNDLLISFFIASALFSFVPGPGMLYAVAQTISSGRRAGWLSAVGFHITGLGHIAAAAVGVSALLAVVPALFIAMKLAGAAYLIWIGIKYLKSSPLQSFDVEQTTDLTARRALRDSIVVEALNPKSALFFLAFLPQFTDATAEFPVWVQIVILGLIVNAMFTLSDAILIETSHSIASRLRSSYARFDGALQKVGGGLLIALGIKLAFSRSQ